MLYIIIIVIIISSLLIYFVRSSVNKSNSDEKEDFDNNFNTINSIYDNIEEYFNLYFNKLIDVNKVNEKLNENMEYSLDYKAIKFQDIFKENQNSERAQSVYEIFITNIYGPIGLLLLTSDNDIPFELLLLALTNMYNIKKQSIRKITDSNYMIDKINYLYDNNYTTSNLKIYTSTQYNKYISYENASLPNNINDILSSKCLVDNICYMNKDFIKNQIINNYKNISISTINDNYNNIMEYIICIIVIFTIYINDDSYINYKDVWYNNNLQISKQMKSIRTALRKNGIIIDTLIKLP